MADEVVDKPITRDERRDLKALIKGDYETLRIKFNQEVQEMANNEAEDIKRKFAGRDEEKQEASRAVREMTERFRREYEDQIRIFAEQGLVPDRRNYSTTIRIELPNVFRVKGLEEELEKSRLKWATTRSRGIASLNTQENDSQRELIMTGLQNSGAQRLLDALPSADDVIKTAISSLSGNEGNRIEIGAPE